jgi:hypothetical protein
VKVKKHDGPFNELELQELYKKGRRLTCYMTSWAKLDEQHVVIFHLDDDDGNDYVAIHSTKLLENIVRENDRAKKMSDFGIVLESTK